MGKHNTILSQALILILLGIGSFSAAAADVTRPADLSFEPVQETQIYKKTPQGKLSMHIFYPENWKASDKRSCIVFFFGGGWVGGSPRQFFEHCRYFASRGMVAISAEYRIKKKHGTTPFECVADGKSAIRRVRANAAKFGIDPKRIVASGGSAGGHVAACTAVIDGFDEKGENLEVSSRPNAMVLFNPVIDTSEKGYGFNKLQQRWKELSPAHHVKKGIVPAIVFHGTADTTVPFENAKRFTDLMRASGNDCTLVSFADKKHGFFNYNRDPDNKSYNKTVTAADDFLTRLGFLEKNGD